jgi:transposase-like protein
MKSETAACNHIHLVKQTGPMDGRSASKRYVCQECPTQFMVEIYERQAHFPADALPESALAHPETPKGS